MIQIIEQQYIVRNDNILGGEPIIQGTRTPVRAIVELWRLGTSPEGNPIPSATSINGTSICSP